MSLCFIALIPTSALAVTKAPSPIGIDFRSSDWSGANYDHSFSFGGVTATAFSSKKKDNIAKLYKSSSDGLGIRGGENDEIDSWEWLVIDFDSPTFVTDIWISDLFIENPVEEGYVELSDGTSIGFKGLASKHGDPHVQVEVNKTLTGATFYGKKVEKTYTSWNGRTKTCLKNTEYSVVGFDTSTSVPDSGNTLILLGMGLVSFAAIRRFRVTR